MLYSVSSLVPQLGIVLVLHSAYSCLHYRWILSQSSLADVHEASYNDSSPPRDVVIECLAGFLLCLLGELMNKSHFLPIVGENRKDLTAPLHRTREFDLFSTRASIVAAKLK